MRGFVKWKILLPPPSPRFYLFFTARENRLLYGILYTIDWRLFYGRCAAFVRAAGSRKRGKANREKRYCSTRSRRENVGFYKKKYIYKRRPGIALVSPRSREGHVVFSYSFFLYVCNISPLLSLLDFYGRLLFLPSIFVDEDMRVKFNYIYSWCKCTLI